MAMDKNKPIKNNTETTGFLLIITKIANNIIINCNIIKILLENGVSFTYKYNIFLFNHASL